MDHMPELGFYTLAGQAASSRDLLDEVRTGEEMGFGTVFISERYDKKEAATLSGAAAAVSDRLTIETAATNHNTRHLMVTAGYARTMQSLTGGRFVLGLGRGIPPMQDAFGIDRITTAQMEDAAGLLRRLFRGEVIVGHDGPAGRFPVLHLSSELDEHLPMSVVAFGPNTLRLAGRCFDEVDLPEALRLKKTVGRLATYLQGYGDLLVRTNDWDPAVLERFRADEVVAGVGGAIDAVATVDQLEHTAGLLPAEYQRP